MLSTSKLTNTPKIDNLLIEGDTQLLITSLLPTIRILVPKYKLGLTNIMVTILKFHGNRLNLLLVNNRLIFTSLEKYLVQTKSLLPDGQKSIILDFFVLN